MRIRSPDDFQLKTIAEIAKKTLGDWTLSTLAGFKNVVIVRAV